MTRKRNNRTIIGVLLTLITAQCYSGRLLEETFELKCGKDRSYQGTQASSPLVHRRIACAVLCQTTEGCTGYIARSESSYCQLVHGKVTCDDVIEAPGAQFYTKRVTCDPTRAMLIEGDCVCHPGYYGDQCQHIVRDCKEAVSKGLWSAEVLSHEAFFIQPLGAPRPFTVGCTPFLGLTVVLARVRSYCPEEYDAFSPNRTWRDYKEGFGSSTTCNFFAGLEALHYLSMTNKPADKQTNLYLTLGGDKKAIFSSFQVQSETQGYRVFFEYDAASSSIADSITSPSDPQSTAQSMPFSTWDRDQDESDDNCAKTRGSGWWYRDCAAVNLFGSSYRELSGSFPVHYEGVTGADIDDHVTLSIGYG